MGRPIEVLWEDSETKPQVAVQKASQLSARGIDMLFGAVSSSETLAVMRIADQRKLPLLVTISTDDRITGQDKSRYVFRTTTQVSMDMRMAAAFAKRRGFKSVYAVSSDVGAIRDGTDLFLRIAEEDGLKILGKDFVPFGTTDFSVVLDKVDRARPDAVFAYVGGTPAVSLIKQAAQIGLKNRSAIFGPALLDDITAPSAGKSGIGVMTGARYQFTIDTAANKRFVDLFHAKYGEVPAEAAGEAYDGMKWWLETIERSGASDAEGWIKAFQGSVNETSVKGRKVMRTCDNQAEQDGLFAEVVEGALDKPAFHLRVIERFPGAEFFKPCSAN